MDRRRQLGLVAAAALAFSGASASATEVNVEKNIVFIVCTLENGRESRGSGVIVSKQGHVLTAKHVVPDGADCRGAIGVAEPNIATRLNPQPLNFGVDAAVLQFAAPGEYTPVPICELDQSAVRKKIFVAGFPGRTKTGVPSYREGVLATVKSIGDGILETDGQTVGGMSGGPVYSENLGGLVGTVIGAEFAPDGTVAHYGILPIFPISQLFPPGILETSRTCYPEEPSAAELLAEIKKLNETIAKLNNLVANVDDRSSTNSEVLAAMGDHPQRLNKAEGQLKEIEEQFNWDALINDRGGIEIFYDKLVSGPIEVSEIGIKVTPFYNELDNRDKIKNIKGNVALNKRARVGKGLKALETSSISGSFELPDVIRRNIFENNILVAEGVYDEDHPITEIELGITPMIGGEVGKPVTVRVPITSPRWSSIVEAFGDGV